MLPEQDGSKCVRLGEKTNRLGGWVKPKVALDVAEPANLGVANHMQGGVWEEALPKPALITEILPTILPTATATRSTGHPFMELNCPIATGLSLSLSVDDVQLTSVVSW